MPQKQRRIRIKCAVCGLGRSSNLFRPPAPRIFFVCAECQPEYVGGGEKPDWQEKVMARTRAKAKFDADSKGMENG